MDSGAIAAMSMSFSTAKVMQQASLSVMRKSMDMQTTQMNSLVSMMQNTPNAPSFGHSFEARV